MLDLAIGHPVELTDDDFEKISRLVYDECGIHLSEGKKELVKARLGKRIRQGSFRSFRDYYHYVIQDESGQELVYLLDSISTNFTHFFREQQHFDYLRLELLPELMAAGKSRGRKLRLWSAGCSSGEEPYSLAITVLESVNDATAWNLKILATDLSTKVLRTAASGIYDRKRIESIPPALIKKYFLKGEGQWKDQVKVKDHVKQVVEFRRLNLMEPFRFQEPFHCIFCRNVMIYFDGKTRTGLVSQFHQCLEKDGVLVIGHSESLTGIRHPFEYIRPTIYRKS